MSSTFLSARVIKHNNTVYQDAANAIVGAILPIPTPGSGGKIGADYWAVPITNYDLVNGFDFEPCKSTDEVPPTIDSFHVFRLFNRDTNDRWYVRGRTTLNNSTGSPTEYGYIQASQDAECCAATPRQLPTDYPLIAPCQLMCTWDENGKYFATWGLPTLIGNRRYVIYGSVNNVAITSVTTTGYATTGTLLSKLNSGITGALGTFAVTGQTLKLTQTAGAGTDNICLIIATVDPSA